VFSGDEYSESNESLNADEDTVGSSPNLKNMCQRKVSPIRHNSWCEKECDLQNPKSVFLSRKVM
jgi:hypothetical protein